MALLNALLLLFVLGAIPYEAIIRFTAPYVVEGQSMIVVALIGIVINLVTVLLFFKDKEKDLNLKGAYLHMVADALASGEVTVAGIFIFYTDWFWVDSVISLMIVLVIAWGHVGLVD